MAFIDGLITAVPADSVSAASTLPTELFDLLDAAAEAASAHGQLLEAAAAAAALLAVIVAAARVLRSAFLVHPHGTRG